MIFLLDEDKDQIYPPSKVPFVFRGEYPIVRFFDSERVMVELNPNRFERKRRIITLLKIRTGEISPGTDYAVGAYDE